MLWWYMVSGQERDFFGLYRFCFTLGWFNIHFTFNETCNIQVFHSRHLEKREQEREYSQTSLTRDNIPSGAVMLWCIYELPILFALEMLTRALNICRIRPKKQIVISYPRKQRSWTINLERSCNEQRKISSHLRWA